MDLLKEQRQDIKQLGSRLDSIDRTLVRNTESLEYHIERTNLLEDKIEKLEDKVVPHINKIQGGIAILGALGLILAVISFLSEKF